MSKVLRVLGYVVVVAVVIGGMVYLGQRQDDHIANGDIPAITSNDWTKGSVNAPIRLIEYSDFQCPSCAANAPIIKQALDGEEARVLFVYRNFPIREKHKNADLAAQMVAAAGRQGKFFELGEKVFAAQEDWGESDKAHDLIAGYFKDLGGDLAKLEKDLADPTTIAGIKSKIDADLQGGIDAGVNGTPTFFVNGKAIETPTTVEAWKTLFDSYGKK